jgi:hypothetical protein
LAESSSLAIPFSILGGSALIAIALYAGLRSREPATSTVTATSPSTPTGTSTSTSTAPPEPPLPPRPDRAIVEAAIGNALEGKRALFRAKCWDPSVAKTPEPKESTYLFEIGVDERGQEISRGISDVGGARPDVGECLRYLIAPVSIPAPGQQIAARVRFRFP